MRFAIGQTGRRPVECVAEQRENRELIEGDEARDAIAVALGNQGSIVREPLDAIPVGPSAEILERLCRALERDVDVTVLLVPGLADDPHHADVGVDMGVRGGGNEVREGHVVEAVLAIAADELSGQWEQQSGAIALNFRARFRFRASLARYPIYAPPDLQIACTLTSGTAQGRRHSATGQPLADDGRTRLVGVARVEPCGDALLDRFLGLPDEALAVLECRIDTTA